jgi:hypothetical protein
MNEIELGMAIPMIESWASKISQDKENKDTGLIESNIVVQPIWSSLNMWESIWISRSRY